MATHQNLQMAIVFADVSGSTRLFEVYGDVRARQIVSRTLDLLMDIVRRQQGKVIKTIGDEVMCTFESLSNCVLAVSKMQTAVQRDEQLQQEKIAIKIGLHFGEVLAEKKDIFGDAVNVAARMVSLAKPNQIITSRATIQQLPSFFMNARPLGSVKVRGKQEKIQIFEVIWQEDLSRITAAVNPLQDKLGASKLVLHYENQEVVLDEYSCPFTLGRHQDNDLVVDTDFASRKHASIEFRNDKFILIDKSTNGLFVRIENQQNFFIHRDEILLHGWGSICLGQEPTDNPAQSIQYRFFVG